MDHNYKEVDINKFSKQLKFIPKCKLKELGYSNLLKFFN